MLLVCGAVAATTEAEPSSDAEALLARARHIFAARERRPFVTYTIVREERAGAAVVAAGTYAERVWYRASDGAAMARRIENGVARGPMIAERPTLDGDVDPGPPTADVFEPGAPAAEATPGAAARPGLPVLAAVTVRGEFDYRARSDGNDDGLERLRLEPRRDPERNRLREVWIDGRSGTLRRFTMRDRIYFAARQDGVPRTFDFREGAADGVPCIVSVASLPGDGGPEEGAATPSVRYRFEDVAFPASLPDWYFDAYVYAKRAREAPDR